jgi:hypothetical protein
MLTVGIATVVPLFVFIKFGKYLDGQYGLAPYASYAGIALATIQVAMSMFAISKRAAKIFEDITT